MALANGIKSSHIWIESHPISRVRVHSLAFEDFPWPDGEDQDHARAVTRAGDCPPPVPVQSPTLPVADGAHRVAAAAHIALTHPQWSDRAIAAVTGISDKTVARIRARSSTRDTAQPSARLGRDGRMRPLDGERRRRRAAAIFLGRPEAGLREVSRATGLSPATVRDVRQRIQRGEDPVPARYQGAQGAGRAPAANRRHTPDTTARIEFPPVPVVRQKLLARPSGDPSPRLSEVAPAARRMTTINAT